MKAIYVICSIALMFVYAGCKQDHAETTPATDSPAPAETVQTAEKQQDSRSVAEGHDYNFLTDKILIFNAVVGASEDEKAPRKNDWIHLMKDGTYMAGRAKDQTHTGQWSYEHNTQTLFLRPDTQNYKMSEWKVMATDKVIVWVGTATYGDNAIQIQLLKSESIPQ